MNPIFEAGVKAMMKALSTMVDPISWYQEGSESVCFPERIGSQAFSSRLRSLSCWVPVSNRMTAMLIY